MDCKNCKVVDMIKKKIEGLDKEIEEQKYIINCMVEEKREIKDKVERHFKEEDIKKENNHLWKLKYAKRVLVEILNEAGHIGCSN